MKNNSITTLSIITIGIIGFGLGWSIGNNLYTKKNNEQTSTYIPTSQLNEISIFHTPRYEDEQDTIEHATVISTKSLPREQTLEHRCVGKKITNDQKTTYCIGTNYLILRKPNPDVSGITDTITVQKIISLEPYQAPVLGDIFLPKNTNGIALITFEHIGCTTPEDPLDPCGAGMPYHNYSLALDLKSGASGPASITSKVEYPNSDGTAYIFPGGRCGGAGCDETQLELYLPKYNLTIDMTSEKGVSSDENPGGDGNAYATWSNIRWSSLTNFSVDFTDKNGKIKSLQLSIPKNISISGKE